MRKGIQFALLLIAVVIGAAALSFAQLTYPRSSPSSKEFTYTAKYPYVERMYAPPVIIPRVSQAPSIVQTAEDALISQFSAVDSLDYDWWVSTWDTNSQQKIADRDPDAEHAKKTFTQLWQPRAGKLSVKLTRWMISGEYVILAYTLSTADQKGATTLPETATAFHLSNGVWRATLDLEGDPILQHFADTKTRFERVVRP